jgi:hypothetical protein
MKDENERYSGGNIFNACHKLILFEIVVNVTANGEKGYEHLYELLFNYRESSKYDIFLGYQLQHLDDRNFQNMLSVNGLNAFVIKLLDLECPHGFDLVTKYMLEKFTTEQRTQLFKIIISEDSGTKSYFDKWFDAKIISHGNYFNDCDLKQILSNISDNLGQSVTEKLLIRNNCEVFKSALIFRGENLIDMMLTFLSNNKDGIVQHLANIAPQLILGVTENCDQPTKERILRISNNQTSLILSLILSKIAICQN